MKRMVMLLATVLLISTTVTAQSRRTRKEWFAGVNPLSYAMAFPLKEEIKRFGPVAAGNEYGFNAVGGFHSGRWHSEARISLGKIHQVAFVGQLHAGTNYHFMYTSKNNTGNSFYLGGYLKYWDYSNVLTSIHFHNVSPYLAAGRQWHIKRWMIDARLNQTICIVSWSDIENSGVGSSWYLSPWPGFIKVLPTAGLTIAYKI